jgi:hypothetical protein
MMYHRMSQLLTISNIFTIILKQFKTSIFMLGWFLIVTHGAIEICHMNIIEFVQNKFKSIFKYVKSN